MRLTALIFTYLCLLHRLTDVDPDDVQKPQYQVYAQSEVRLKIRNVETEDGLKERDLSEPASLAKALIPDVIKALRSTLEREEELCKKKCLYVRLGCRGDWPNVELPDWARGTPS